VAVLDVQPSVFQGSLFRNEAGVDKGEAHGPIV
jgi:hypothetical protein